MIFYPSKILKHISDNPEIFDEETVKRQAAFDLQGASIYDITYREDDYGRKKQKEYYGRTSTKFLSGLTEPVLDTTRAITKTLLEVASAVGSDNAADAVAYLEANWPRADDMTYPNKENFLKYLNGVLKKLLLVHLKKLQIKLRHKNL